MQGVPSGFALTAVANYLAAEGVPSWEIGRFIAIVGLPWTLQFVWGPLIDRFQDSPMGRRRPWVLCAQGCAFLASLMLLRIDDPSTQLNLLACAFLGHSVFASIQDASVDAMAITLTSVDERGRVNAFMRGGMLTGSALGAAGFAYLLRAYGFRTAALLQAVLLFSMMLATFFLKEQRADRWITWPGTARASSLCSYDVPHTLRTLFLRLFRGLTRAVSLRFFAVIAVVYLAQSVFQRTMAVYLIQELGWQDTELSLLSGTVGTAVAVGVALAGGILADRLGARRMLAGVGLGNGLFLLTFALLLAVSHTTAWLAGGMTLSYLMDPVFSVAAFPILMALCVPGVEGSQFTTYMALINLADVAGAYLSGWLLPLVPAPFLVLAAGGTLVSNAILIGYLMRRVPSEAFPARA